MDINITGYIIIRMNLPEEKIILMELKAFSYAKRRLHKFNGIRKNMFILHLKESEFRWNNRKDLYQKLIVNFREKPL